MTEDLYGVDNANVAADGPVRTSVIGLAVMALLTLAWLPPEHVHVTHADDGRHSEVIHRHYEAHHPVDETAVDHDEHELVQWLDSPFTGPTKVCQGSPGHDARLEGLLPVELTLQTTSWTPFFIHLSVHDPPWRTSPGLRGPPHGPRLI